MLFKEGDTFLYRYPKQTYHLFFVVTNIISVNGVVQYVCSMVSSWKDGSKFCDPACVLNAGEHPFIEHKSYVAYRETILFREDQLIDLLANGNAISKEPLSGELLQKIKNAAQYSDMISPMLLEYYKKK